MTFIEKYIINNQLKIKKSIQEKCRAYNFPIKNKDLAGLLVVFCICFFTFYLAQYEENNEYLVDSPDTSLKKMIKWTTHWKKKYKKLYFCFNVELKSTCSWWYYSSVLLYSRSTVFSWKYSQLIWYRTGRRALKS